MALFFSGRESKASSIQARTTTYHTAAIISKVWVKLPHRLAICLQVCNVAQTEFYSEYFSRRLRSLKNVGLYFGRSFLILRLD